MKTILFGNKYIGYKPISERVDDFVIFCSQRFFMKDLREWRDKAAHGDRFVFDRDDKNREFLCVE